MSKELICSRCGRDGILVPNALFILRHGQTKMNAEHLIIGCIDDPLNETGRSQAYEVAIKLKRENEVFDIVISSTLSRARETAEIIGRYLKLKVYADPRLCERCVGDYENKSEFPNMLKEFLGTELPAPNAESLSAFKKRVLELLYEISSSSKSALLITHALPLLIILGEIKNWTLESLLQHKIPINCVPIKFYFGEPCRNCGSKFYEPKSE